MFGIGPIELAVVLIVALLVMGPKKLPELARTVGRGLAEFRRASNDLRRSMDFDLESHKIEPPPGPAQAGSPYEASMSAKQPKGQLAEPEPSNDALASASADNSEQSDAATSERKHDTEAPGD